MSSKRIPRDTLCQSVVPNLDQFQCIKLTAIHDRKYWKHAPNAVPQLGTHSAIGLYRVRDP